ncbi:glutathione peroxidase [Actinoplanes cyaneus]|uniref:Glutathione peroxidase n=1 Tax=Actinoplanes cyaneus TaxID=52696 RepID=A0A919IHT3_9ACTN|nr:glutathione peroxidase [Actinoplanes cyaneus]MCW2140304.1 glutathione peroxidase [Actinoplanes cyaneus]GID65622.1 glutathione peroxidase [Actinoplanes cyaneus]
MTVHDFVVTTADGGKQQLSDYAGRVLLIVNVASRCGMTPQYAGLEALHREFGDRGLQVLGFPCNQFGAQEPGTDAEIQEFCSVNYDVTFPVLAKVDVNGPDAAPLYEYLRGHVDPAEDVRWNFTKFLVDRDGTVIRRYEPKVTPEEIGKDVAEMLS